MTRSEFEAALRAEARSWLGVGFLNNGRTRSQGVDCIGLVLCVYAGLGLVPPPWVGAYRGDWYLHAASDPYFDMLLEEGVAVPKDQLRAGDVLLFVPGRLLRAGRQDVVTHSAIYLGDGTFVQAVNKRGVHVANLADRAWVKSYEGARRPKQLAALLKER